MEKLGQLHAQAQQDEHGWDLIVVDTPPSRSALDFLDAPEHLSSLLDGRLIKLLVAPARGPARMLSAGLGVVTGAMTKVLGAQVLKDVQTFVAAFDTLFGGFRQRAEATYALLQARADRVRRGRDARGGRAARGGLLRRAAGRGPDAAGGPGAQPGGVRPGAAAVRRPAPGRRPSCSRRDRRRRAGSGGAGCCGCTPACGRQGPAAAAAAALRRGPPGGGDDVEVPALAGDVHDVDGLRPDRRPADRSRRRPGRERLSGRTAACGEAGGGTRGAAGPPTCRPRCPSGLPPAVRRARGPGRFPCHPPDVDPGRWLPRRSEFRAGA